MTTSDENDSSANASWLQLYLHGLSVSVTGNAQAFGFSILITVSYGVISTAAPKPSPSELFGFALSAVAAFTVLNLLVSWLKTVRARDLEKTQVLLIATATDFVAVAAGLGVAFGATALVGGWRLWVLAPFLIGLTYGLVQALQIAVTHSSADESD